MAGTVGGPGRVTGADRALGAVVVVDGFAGEDEIALAVAVMLVISENRSGGNRNARVKPALVGKLFVENLLNRDRHRTVRGRHGHRFHDIPFDSFKCRSIQLGSRLSSRIP